MSDQSRTTRKIRQGKVDIDYEDSSLIIHYDLELVGALLLVMIPPSASSKYCHSELFRCFPHLRYLPKRMVEEEETLLREYRKRRESRYPSSIFWPGHLFFWVGYLTDTKTEWNVCLSIEIVFVGKESICWQRYGTTGCQHCREMQIYPSIPYRGSRAGTLRASHFSKLAHNSTPLICWHRLCYSMILYLP